MSLATRHTVERAIAAYTQTATLGGKTIADFGGKFKGEETGPTLPINVHTMPGEVGEDGAIPEEWSALKLPALVVSSSDSQPHPCGYDICEVSLTCITTPDEINAPTQVQLRTGWLSALFDEDRLDEITASLNAPPSGPDTRPVKGITVIGIERAGEAHSNNGMHVMDVLRLRVHAIGEDA